MPGLGSPLVIAQAPLSVITSSGSTATFEVVASGSGVVAYQWQTTDHAIARASGYNPSFGSGEPAGFWPILGATSASYTTSILTTVNNGAQFQCLLSNTISTPLMLFSELMTVPVFVVVVNPQILFSDNFNRANEDPLNPAKWVQNTDGYDQLQIVNNQCEDNNSVAAGIGEMFANAVFPNNQFSFATVGAVSSGEYLLTVRAQGHSSANCYYISLGFLEAQWNLVLVKSVGGVSTILAQTTLPQVQTGDIVGIKAVGTTISALYKGQTLLSETDSTFSSGNIGLLLIPAVSLSDTTVTLITAGG